jgi:hypothetical protein
MSITVPLKKLEGPSCFGKIWTARQKSQPLIFLYKCLISKLLMFQVKSSFQPNFERPPQIN